MAIRAEHCTKYIVIHHSEVSIPHTAEDIHRWHQNKGWAGIGYHYFISKAGIIYEGRPHDTVGAYTKGYNVESVGVCFEGDFNKERIKDKQLDASVMLLSLLSLAYDDATICKHSQLTTKKTCPGTNFPYNSLMKKINKCKHFLKSLFGDPIYTSFVADDEWLSFNDRLGDEELRRHNAPDIIYYGHFNYKSIINLLSENV